MLSTLYAKPSSAGNAEPKRKSAGPTYRQHAAFTVMPLPNQIARFNPYSDTLLVHVCRGRAVFDSCDEAHEMMRLLQPHGRLNLGAYSCPLCHGIHIGSRRRPKAIDEPNQASTTRASQQSRAKPWPRSSIA
jgi:hypothetical protein